MTIRKLYERSPSSSSTVSSPRSSSPMKTSAVSPFFGTTRMRGLPNSLLEIGVELSDFLDVHADLSALRLRLRATRTPGYANGPAISPSRRTSGPWCATAPRSRRIADDLGRHAGHGDVVRHRLEHDRARRDARAMADLDVAEDLRARADQHAAADLRMAVAVVLAGAAERHVVQDRDIVARSPRSRRPRGRWRDRGRCRGRSWRAGWMSHWNTADERLCR